MTTQEALGVLADSDNTICNMCRVINPQHKDCHECLDRDFRMQAIAILCGVVKDAYRAAKVSKVVTQELIHAWSIQWQKKSAEAIEGYLTGALHALGYEIKKGIPPGTDAPGRERSDDRNAR